MRSGCRQKALAEQPARAERDLRLQDVIAGAERVALGIEEGVEPRSSGNRAAATRPAAPPPPRRPTTAPNIHSRTPARKNMIAPLTQQHHRGAEVGLLQHQRGRHDDQQRRHDQIDDAAAILGVEAVEIARQRQHQRDLHQLGRLQLDERRDRSSAAPPCRSRRANRPHDQRQRQRRRSSTAARNQWRMSISAAAIIGTKAIAKRAICFDAQGCKLPLAAEYSIAKPMPAIALISRTRPQLMPRSLSAKVSSWRPISGDEARCIAEPSRAASAAAGTGGGVGTATCATESGCGTRRAGSRFCASSSTSRQIGAATAEPPPPLSPPCSTTTAQT